MVILYQRRQIAGLAARLSDATRTDPLTGLLNRRAFVELLDSELERSRRTGRPLSVLVGDLDGLGLVNARRGHRAGDGILQLVARDMQKWKRRIDSVGRIGGEEFALLLPETDEGGALLSHPGFDDLRGWILAHHERPDGRGYPRGLSGDAIPLESRILAVADAFEAMTADRTYRPALGEEAAHAELEAGAGTQFDAEVVAAFRATRSREAAASLPRAS
ncbi:MAG: diguanylate cyclase [Thermoleophilaceae bacterium]